MKDYKYILKVDGIFTNETNEFYVEAEKRAKYLIDNGAKEVFIFTLRTDNTITIKKNGKKEH